VANRYTDGNPRFSLVVSRGYVRLVRQGRQGSNRVVWPRIVRRNGIWEATDEPEEIDPDVLDDIAEQEAAEREIALWADGPDPELEDVIPEEDLHPVRGYRGLSARSRMNMRRTFVSLPWELVGPRPALISLTYPGEWKPWVIDGRAWEAHRRAFERRWVRRWSEPLVGVWVKEFQTSGRPHLHLYVGLPANMSDEDFAQLRERTLQRHRLERQLGRYQGRRQTPPLALGDSYGSEFGRWLLKTWSEIVGSSDDGDWRRQFDTKGTDYHRTRGADVAVMFWSDEAEQTTDRTRVAQYLAREAGKFAQKQPPPGFHHIGRYYGVWGRNVGFKVASTATAVEPAVAAEIEARLARWLRLKLRSLRPPDAEGPITYWRRPGDGVTAFGLGPEQAARILAWSEKAAARRQARGRPRGDGREDPGAFIELLNRLDLETGEILPPPPAAETETA
jgi:hypothetical protein